MKIIRFLFVLIIFFCSTICANAQISVLKSSSSADFYSDNHLGNYKDIWKSFETSMDNANLKYSVIQEKNLTPETLSQTKILILPYIVELEDETLLQICSFVKNGGKLIAIMPDFLDTKTVIDISNLLNVNLRSINRLSQRNYINWPDYPEISDNDFPISTPFLSLKLPKGTKSVAVWGQEEENIPAATLAQFGSYITWRWGVDGNKTFNSSVIRRIADILVPNIVDKEEKIIDYPAFSKKINQIGNYREDAIFFTENSYKPQPINALAEIQEKLYLSEIQSVIAENNYKKGFYDEAIQELENADKNISDAYQKVFPSQLIEFRTVWIDRGTIVSINSQREMAELFDKLKQAKINIAYFETINAGYTIYPSKIAEQSPQTKGKDPLKWAIIEAHKRNIELHAWTWIFAVGNTRHNPIINVPENFNGPVISKNPQWALLGPNENMIPFNQHEFWISPSNSEGRKYLISLLEEIATNYDIDGIQYDYIRYPFQSPTNLMGFDNSSKFSFETQTMYKLEELNSFVISEWNLWKANNITSFVKTASESLRKIKPNIKISAAVFGGTKEKRLASIQQDWETWTKNGWVDILNPMIYAFDSKRLEDEINIFKTGVGNNALVLPGIAVKNLSNIETLEQIALTQNKGLMGQTLFAYAFLSPEKINLLNYGAYKQPARYDFSVCCAQLLMSEFFEKIKILAKNENSPSFVNFIETNEADIKDCLFSLQNNLSEENIEKAISMLENFEFYLCQYSLEREKISNQRVLFFNNYIEKTIKILHFEKNKLKKVFLKNKII
ncbi:MAG: family 10 glycosylhydrolase [Candidatus Gastranaerophilales bacterium]|nr:family 10 glycosylhydrolase [Candidatus Gastranaerophilales bacterium]